ncbi:ornithine carbamoyltransferase [Actinokineospora sp. PR83]|uniref:ornithine carbamoyltransferase n=1 Tax=Actinokineospora sp. PR83 TaxID=2884908 RepID=UPI001F1A20FF|nr:ornithine carbamoyltransferase [Actinokineospora sp. PR83]MCG8914450.1 ornithine carbamoyltransferase [Actinokineospora sp. PR83]
MRSLISTDDLTDTELHRLVVRGAEFAAHGPPAPGDRLPLAGRVAGMYFQLTSTRTRTAFGSAALRLGAGVIAYGPGDLQTNTGESAHDTGRVLGGMLDVLVARVGQPDSTLREWAGTGMAVVNAMAEEEHPTQALTDLSALWRRFGRIEGLRVLYLGEGNNTAAALALTLSRFPGVRFELRTPPGYGLLPRVAARAAEHAARSGAVVVERHDADDLPEDCDAIYTTRWQTTGTSKPDPAWRSVFAPFRVTERLWRTSPKALFLHDLPAHRGDEVTAAVLDGPASVAFEQAATKACSAMAVLEWCLAG